MKKTFTTVAAAAAVWALVTLPATAQSSGSGATDQQGSTHGDQAGSAGTGQSGSGQTGTSGQSGTGTATKSGTTTAGASATSANGSSQDRTFIMEAAEGGMAEVELGRLATQKASRSEVKDFGQMMVDDHTKANDELTKIAQDKGLAAPHALKPQDKAMQDRLSKLSGEAFDRAYMQHMVKDHQKDVAVFKKQSTSASDPDVKQFASSTLPTLEKHLNRAKEVEQILGGDTARGTSGQSSTPGSTSETSTKTKGTHGGTKSGSTGSGSSSGTGSGSNPPGTPTPPPQR